MITLFLIGDTAIFVTGIEASRQDVWIIEAASDIIGLSILMLSVYIFKSTNNNLTGSLQKTFGTYIGNFIAFFYILYFIFLCSITLKNISAFINYLILPRFPVGIINIFVIIICFYAVVKGLESISRTSEIIFIAALIMGGLFFVSSLGQVNPQYIFPMMDLNFSQAINAFKICSTICLGQGIIFLTIISFIKTRSNYYNIGYSLLIAGLYLILGHILTITTFSPALAANFNYPLMETIRHIQIGKFIQRIDVLLILLTFGVVYIKISLLYYVIIEMFKDVFKLNNSRYLIIPLGILILLMSINMYNNNIEKYELGSEAFPILSLPFLYIIPILMGIILVFKNRKKFNTGGG